jgi:hypothetical protein
MVKTIGPALCNEYIAVPAKPKVMNIAIAASDDGLATPFD